MRFIVRLISACAILLVFSFVFLRLYGVPGPVLREVVRRANAAGVPVDVDKVNLSLHGWRASNVRYYSRNPDDLHPLVEAEEVLFERFLAVDDPSDRWNLKIAASGVRLCPSIEWGIQVPEEAACRRIEELELSVGFAPDRIELSEGRMNWLGINFLVGGSFIKRTGTAQPGEKAEPSKPSVFSLTEEQFLSWQDQLKSVRLDRDTVIELDFELDANDLLKSRLEFRAFSEGVAFREVEFSDFEVSGYYAYPAVVLDQAALFMGRQSVRLEGQYDLGLKEVQGSIRNSITSKDLLLLLPQSVLDLLVTAELRFEHLPQFSADFGPAQPMDLLNGISGRFSIQEVTYCDLLVESLRGNFVRDNNVLKISNVQGTVDGQEERAEEIGSSLVGGYIGGDLYWDANTEEFGVSASGSFDPNLLLKPLSIVPVATNAISRFKFEGESPEISLELGSSYVDWSTFYIHVQGQGEQVRLHDALLSKVNAIGFYKGGVLKLDPISIENNDEFLKGQAAIDFRESTVWFDAFGTLQPEVIEDGVYPAFNLFGNRLNTSGNVQIKAMGTLDWETMEKTDFVAEVEAEHFDVPVAQMNDFSGTVIGMGPLITVTNAICGLYGGEAEGQFSVSLAPGQGGLPYSLGAKVKDVGFREIVLQVGGSTNATVSGNLSGSLSVKADLSERFFATANGAGQIRVDDGQLADLPLFSGFSRLVRKVIPGFNAFSITSLTGDFVITDGVISSENAYFDGDVISARGKGRYSVQTGFDAKVHGQILNDNRISKVFRVITDPIFKLFEMRLTGPLENPEWEMDRFGAHATKNPKEPDR